MDKKLKRLIQPGYHFYFAIFLLFALSCAYVSPVMAAIGVAVCACMYVVYREREKRRRREMMVYLQGVTLDAGHSSRSSIIDFPLPTIIVRASTNDILWTNDAFCEATGHWDCAPNTSFRELAPDFDTHWLAEGKGQYPGELQIDQRFFWVYGSLMTEKDVDEVLLVLYFVPCTEYIHCRDRYTLSRPIVSIISIDNYEELTKTQPTRKSRASLRKLTVKLRSGQRTAVRCCASLIVINTFLCWKAEISAN